MDQNDFEEISENLFQAKKLDMCTSLYDLADLNGNFIGLSEQNIHNRSKDHLRSRQ